MSMEINKKDTNPLLQCWEIKAQDYPIEAPLTEQLKFCLKYALLAPSSHNSQPWLFRIVCDDIELYVDRTKALPVVDPDDRELIISCGAALFHLKTALRYFGFTFSVELFPKPVDPDLLATIHISTKRRATPQEKQLWGAICRRHTNRQPFQERSLSYGLLNELTKAAAAENCWLEFITDESKRNHMALLISEGDRQQMADKSFRRELAAWIHPNRARSADGLPGYAMGIDDLSSYLGPLILRTFDLGNGTAAKDLDLAKHSPVLAVLGTNSDIAVDWLMTGQALDRILLRACADDVCASFLNQPIEIPALRIELAKLLEHQGHPQFLLRMGYGPATTPTPRRAIEDVLKL